MFDLNFPKADPVPRGCGEREPGGVYAESGLSPRGRPLEEFSSTRRCQSLTGWI